MINSFLIFLIVYKNNIYHNYRYCLLNSALNPCLNHQIHLSYSTCIISCLTYRNWELTFLNSCIYNSLLHVLQNSPNKHVSCLLPSIDNKHSKSSVSGDWINKICGVHKFYLSGLTFKKNQWPCNNCSPMESFCLLYIVRDR